MWITGEGCNGLDPLPLVSDLPNAGGSLYNISSLDNMYFGCQINNDVENYYTNTTQSTLLGFENGYDFPITFGMRSDVFYDYTKVFIQYYNETYDLIEKEFYYDEIWDSNSDEHLTFYVGSAEPETDDYFRFKNIDIEHCGNEWDGSRSVCESLDGLINDTSSSSSSNLPWSESGSQDITEIDVSGEIEVAHGWLDYNENKTLILDELPLFSQAIIDMKLYVTNFTRRDEFNFSAFASLDALDIFTLKVIIYDDFNRTETIVTRYLAQQDTCVFNNPEIRTDWYTTSHDGETVTGVCQLDLLTVIGNFSGLAHNFTMILDVDKASKDSGDDLLWAFSDVCINFTDIEPTVNPSPAPTWDTTFFACENGSISNEDFTYTFTNNGSDLLIGSYTEYPISRTGTSYIKIKLLMSDDYYSDNFENYTNIAVLLSDSVKYSAVNIKADEIEFNTECKSKFFSRFEKNDNDTIILPEMKEIDWYPHSSIVFRDPTLEFHQNEIDVEFYFDPQEEYRSYAYVERIDAGGNVIDSECQWKDLYRKDDDLNIYVLMTNVSDTHFITGIELEYCAENRHMFTTTRAPDVIAGELGLMTGSYSLGDDSDDGNTLEYATEYDMKDCVSNDTCVECLRYADMSLSDPVDGSYSYNVYFGGYSNIVINEEYNCSCPIGNGTFDISTGEGVITLKDGTVLYLYLGIDNDNDDIGVELLRISFDGPVSGIGLDEQEVTWECDLVYYVNSGTFVNVSAYNILHFRYILTDLVHLNSTQHDELEYLWSRYFANIFGIPMNRSIVTVNMSESNVAATGLSDTETDTETETETETERRRRRRISSQSNDTTAYAYDTDVVIYAYSTEDAINFNLTEHYATLVEILCNISGIQCEEMTNGEAASAFSNVTSEIVSEEEDLTYPDNNNDASTAGDDDITGTGAFWIWVFLLVLILCCCWALCWWCIRRRDEEKYEEKQKDELLKFDVQDKESIQFVSDMQTSIVVDDENGEGGKKTGQTERKAKEEETKDEDEKDDGIAGGLTVIDEGNDDDDDDGDDGENDTKDNLKVASNYHKPGVSFPSVLVETNDDLFELPDYVNRGTKDELNVRPQQDMIVPSTQVDQMQMGFAASNNV